MSKFYSTTKEILESVKRRIMMPTSQNSLSDQDLLDFGTEEVNLAIVPMINSNQEDYFLVYEDIPLQPGINSYSIPYRATGNKLKDVAFYTSNLNNPQELTRINVSDLPTYQNMAYGGQISAFYVMNNEIVIVGDPNNFPSGKLRMYYYIRPNSLVPLDEVCIISAIDTVNKQITVSNIPNKFLNAAGQPLPTLTFDIVSTKSPHKCLSFDMIPVSVNVTTGVITFDQDLPRGLILGDHLALATETAIPQIPSDLHVMLAHRIAARCLEAVGDSEGLQNANLKLAEMQKNAVDLIDDRVEDAAKKIINRRSTIRNGLTSRRYTRR